MSAIIKKNAEKNGIEVAFSARPDAETLAALKTAGFRWHNARRVWYAKETPERVALAEKLAGGVVPSAPTVSPSAPKKAAAPWAVDKALLRAEFAKVWPKDSKMIDYCVNKAAAVAVLPDGGLIVIDKRSIETSFCFGESGYDYEDAQQAAAHARESETYFKRENMRGALDFVKDLRDALDGAGRYSLIIRENQYISQTPDCLLRGYQFEDLFAHALPPRSRMATPEEARIIIAAAEAAAAAHEKKVDAYLKRYGTSKVRAWTYWRDA